MKKKGFTLVELLSVIVVLAIIAVIAIPTLINVIDKSRKNALKDSAYGVIESGRLYVAQNQPDQDILFTITNNNITSEQTNKLLKYKGNIKNGIVIVSTSSKIAICIDDGKNYAAKLLDEEEVKVGIGTCESYEAANGEFVVNSPTAELRKEYERQLEEQKTYYEEQLLEQKNNYEDQIENKTNHPFEKVLSKQTGYYSRTPNAKTATLSGLTVGKTYIFFITAAAFGGNNADIYNDVGIQNITAYTGMDNVTVYKDNLLKGTATSTTLTVTFTPKNGNSAAWDTWSGVRETNHLIAIELY